jgi:hypothetical protein
MRKLALLILLSALAIHGQQSQPPSPSSGKEHSPQRDAQSKGIQAQAAPSLQGTESFPLWVKVVQAGTDQPTPKTDAEKAKGGSPANWRIDPNWWVAAFTLLLVFIAAIQAGFFYWQLGMMKESLSDSKKAADAAGKAAEAAMKSADIAANAERAWITTDVRFSSDWPDISKEGGPTRSVMIVLLKNAGRSPAEITRVRILSFAYPSDYSFPEKPIYGGSDDIFEVHAAPGEIVSPSEDRTILSPIQQIDLLTAEGKTEIMTGIKRLYCYGKIEYKDLSGAERVTQFGFQFYVRNTPSDNRPEAMYRMKNRAYNYTT